MPMSDDELGAKLFLDYVCKVYAQFPGYTDVQIVDYVVSAFRPHLASSQLNDFAAMTYRCIAYMRKGGYIR